jgi:hypothetical protein
MKASPSREKLESLLAGEGEALIKTAIERARAGDGAALRLAIDRLLPPVRERFLKFDLPQIESVADLPRAVGCVLASVAKGELTPSEGNSVCAMLSTMRSAFELITLEERLSALERALPGSTTLPRGGFSGDSYQLPLPIGLPALSAL